MKKTMAALFILGSSAAGAGTMGCTPGNVTVPCEKTAWDVGFYALYLQPMFDADLAYVETYTNAQNHQSYRDFDFDMAWGFKLEGSYHFNTGNDINLNWTHYQHTTNKNFLIGTAMDPIHAATAIKNQWDALNFELAQHVDFGAYKNIRFHGGVQYANIRNGSKANYVIDNVRTQSAVNAKFSGFGPRAGADFSYDFGNGFELYANGATALLVGSTSFDATSVSTFRGVSNTINFSGSKNALVPEIEAKLGAKYNHAMAQGVLIVDAGWMAVNYFNANHVLTTTPFTNGESDMAYNGPYVGLKWISNA